MTDRDQANLFACLMRVHATRATLALGGLGGVSHSLAVVMACHV